LSVLDLDEENTIINESFRGISLMQNVNFNEKVPYRFPIATSEEDLKEILYPLIKLNKDFIGYLAEDTISQSM